MGTLGTLLKQLQDGEVTFEFRTTEGKIRKARGTLNQNMIPKDDWAKGATIRRPGPKVDEISVRLRTFQPFYDLEISQWRRFKPMNVMRIISHKPHQRFGTLRKILSVFKKPKEDEDTEF
jgi:hypothetical protein